MKYLLFAAILLILGAGVRAAGPAPVDKYPIHDYGGLIYDPLSRYAKRAGTLSVDGPVTHTSFSFGGASVNISAPKKCRAYSVVPIDYSISPIGLRGRTALSVNCFEKKHPGTFFDLNIPGKLSVRPRFLGTMTADLLPGVRNIMMPDLSDDPGKYPNFKRRPFLRSGTIEAGDIVWFRYSFTNNGDTILDPEGWGGWCYMAELYRLTNEGKWEPVGDLYNKYGRIDKYLYPGESQDVWFSFNSCRGEADGKTPQNLGLYPGEYKVRLNFIYRWYRDIDEPLLNQWSGKGMAYFEQPFTVSEERVITPVKDIVTLYSDRDESAKDPAAFNKIPRWLHYFEEFMSSMVIFGDTERCERDARGNIKGTIYLQMAPWAKYITVKLTDEAMKTAGVQIPVSVSDSSLSVNYLPDHKYQLVKDEVRYPVIYTQNMADMRNHVHHTPYPEKHIWQNMRVMKECGVNVLGLTAMPWLYDFIKGPYIYSQPTEECNQNGDAMKYFLDIAREEGFMVNGWGQYPFNRFSVEEVYNWLTGSHATLERSSFMEISYDEPLLPAANSALWMYQFKRWGDLYFQTEDGAVPFDVEDTRGWMRMDINIRYPIGAATLTAFRNWLRSKYVSISRLNDAWGSAYASFDDIDPEKDATPNRFGHQYEYYDRSRIFHDWTPAMEDFDLFRSLVRVQNYSDTLREVRKQIPGAAICIRTEGGNYLVSGLDPESPNPHIRHVYYSQRRAAVIAEALQQSDTVKFHSDYVTMPYTPDEITYLTTLGVSQGIIPIQLPQFDHMRDIAVNDRYGYDYDVTYNLPEPAKGVMMHCLTAVFPWWKALYEAGGVPGATWEDFECDGIVFETQRREMKLFVKKLAESMNTPENRAARTRDVRQPDDSFRDAAAAKRSFVTDRSVLKIKEEGR